MRAKDQADLSTDPQFGTRFCAATPSVRHGTESLLSSDLPMIMCGQASLSASSRFGSGFRLGRVACYRFTTHFGNRSL